MYTRILVTPLLTLALALLLTACSSTPKTAAAPAAPEDKVLQQWGEFLRYGPELATLLKKSDEINRIHAEGAAKVTASNVVGFYQLTEKAAQSHEALKKQALLVKVPREGNAFQQSVWSAIKQREEAMNTLKVALDKPGVAATAAFQTAKQQVDRSALGVVAELFKLCATMQSDPEECRQTVGLTE